MDKNVKIDLAEYKRKLVEFSKRSNRLYIYGAGNFGKGYLDVLQHYGCNVDGFVVTEKRTSAFLDRPVYSASEIAASITEEDGIIPAFTNSNVQEIEGRFIYARPRILEFEHKIMSAIENEIHFYPIIAQLDKEFPKLNKRINHSEWKSILIVRLDVIGDTIFTTPFIRELRKNFPKSRISVVIRRQNQELLKDCPYIDELFLYDSELLDGELAEQCQAYLEVTINVRRFAEENFKGKNYNVVFFPRELLCGRNAIDELVLAYYSRAEYRFGRMLNNEYDKQLLCNRLIDSFTQISTSSGAMHEAAYALDMLKKCGCRVEDDRMELWINPNSESYVARLLKKYNVERQQILIAVGIVASVDTRTWKAENYNCVIRHYGEVSGRKVRFVVMGGKDAKNAAVRLDNAYGNIIDLTGETNLNETGACMKQCDLYIGSNTGLLHFASALGVPSVTIYSELSDGKPTDGDSPFRMGAWRVPHVDLVPPAGLDGCHGVCRMRFSHCINQITPEQVITSIDRLLKSRDEGEDVCERDSV